MTRIFLQYVKTNLDPQYFTKLEIHVRDLYKTRT